MTTVADLPAIYQAIGRFVYEFSRLEDRVRMVLEHILSIDADAFSLLSAGMDFAFLCNATKAAAKENSDMVKDEGGLAKILSRCLEINTERNRVVHGTWVAGVSYHTSRNSLAGGEYFLKPGELDQLADELIKLRGALTDQMKS